MTSVTNIRDNGLRMSESDPVDEERGAARDEGGVRRMTQQSARRRHAAASAEHRHCAAACADPIAVAIRHFTATPPDTLAARVAPSPRFSRPPRPPRSLFPPRHATSAARPDQPRAPAPRLVVCFVAANAHALR